MIADVPVYKYVAGRGAKWHHILMWSASRLFLITDCGLYIPRAVSTTRSTTPATGEYCRTCQRMTGEAPR